VEYITWKITLLELFLLYWASYLAWYMGEIRAVVIENVSKILKSRTPLLGYHRYKCKNCSSVRLIPHSCKSRFCNSCGKVMTDKWIDERLSDVLSVDYHNLVFTVPWQLRSNRL